LSCAIQSAASASVAKPAAVWGSAPGLAISDDEVAVFAVNQRIVRV
jgi:hypothetical protein